MVSILVSMSLTYEIRIIAPPFISETNILLIDESGMLSVALDAEIGDTHALKTLLMESVQPSRCVDTVVPLKFSDHGATKVSAFIGVSVVSDAIDKTGKNSDIFMIIS